MKFDRQKRLAKRSHVYILITYFTYMQDIVVPAMSGCVDVPLAAAEMWVCQFAFVKVSPAERVCRPMMVGGQP